MPQFRVFLGATAPAPLLTWQRGERAIAWLVNLDKQLPRIFAAALGFGLGALQDPIAIVALIVTAFGVFATRRFTKDEPSIAILGLLTLLLGGGVAVILLDNGVQRCAMGALIAAEISCRVLDNMRYRDRNRLMDALGRNRGVMSPYGSTMLEEQLGRELATPNLRANLDDEIRQLVASTRQTCIVSDRVLHVTTDREVQNFGADSFEAYHRELAGSTFCGDLKRAFPSMLFFVAIGWIVSSLS